MVHSIQKIEPLTWFLVGAIVICGGVAIIPFFIFLSEEATMLINRGMACIGGILFLVVTVILWAYMSGFIEKQRHPIGYFLSTSIKLFLFVMTTFSMIGYFMKIPYNWILKDYDFALNYTYFWPMMIIDNFYPVAILLYLPTQLFYLWFYYPVYGFFGRASGFPWIVALFGITLIENFWQKWEYETLISREEICEKLHLMNRTCIGHRHYHTNISMMTDTERQVYDLNEMLSPLSYSATMEILVVYLVVLCYSKSGTTHNQAVVPNDAGFHDIRMRILKIIAAILMGIALVLSVAFIGFNAITDFKDEKNPREIETLITNILKTIIPALGVGIFGILTYIYWDITPENEENMQQNVILGADRISLNSKNQEEQHGCCCKFCIFCWLCPTTFHEPDLLILQITWWITLFMKLVKIALQFFGFITNAAIDWSEVKNCMLPDILVLIRDALNVKLIMSFLSTTNATLIHLSSDRFTKRFMIPFQVLRSFAQAAGIFIDILNPEAPPKGHDAIDQWVYLIDATYPFTVLISITSALCWSHVLEKFFANGAYNVGNNTNANGNRYIRFNNDLDQDTISNRDLPIVAVL